MALLSCQCIDGAVEGQLPFSWRQPRVSREIVHRMRKRNRRKRVDGVVPANTLVLQSLQGA